MLIILWKNQLVIYHGDIYFSEEAIKTIVETKVKDTMFFCVRDVSDGRPTAINAKGREPLAYKVQNQKIFRKAINDLLQMVDEGEFKADPIAWNLYRKINNLPIAFNWSGSDIFTTNGDYIAIDDYTTDIDSVQDIAEVERFIKMWKGGIEMIRVEVIEEFHLGKFNELKNIVRKSREENGRLFMGDTFECTEDMAKYLMETNATGRAFVKVIEVIPEKVEEVIEQPKEEVQEEVKEVKPIIEKKRTRKTRKSLAKED